jgi:hypothetical protein
MEVEKEGRCKFWCSESLRERITLEPVTHGSEENRAFWQATPAGKITLCITTSARDLFVVGREYYVDFTPVKPTP